MTTRSRTQGSGKRKHHKEGEKKLGEQGEEAERPGLTLPESETDWHLGGQLGDLNGSSWGRGSHKKSVDSAVDRQPGGVPQPPPSPAGAQILPTVSSLLYPKPQGKEEPGPEESGDAGSPQPVFNARPCFLVRPVQPLFPRSASHIILKGNSASSSITPSTRPGTH